MKFSKNTQVRYQIANSCYVLNQELWNQIDNRFFQIRSKIWDDVGYHILDNIGNILKIYEF